VLQLSEDPRATTSLALPLSPPAGSTGQFQPVFFSLLQPLALSLVALAHLLSCPLLSLQQLLDPFPLTGRGSRDPGAGKSSESVQWPLRSAAMPSISLVEMGSH
jgi:hypothetical protein